MTPRRLLIALAAWAAGAALFFHEQVFSGFAWLGGDIGDVRLGVFLVEHWRNVFTGAGDWLTPPYFHPFPRTLVLTDATFFMALPHAALRWLGVDELLAFQLTVIAFSLVGVLGFTALATSLLRVPFAIALTAALGFTFSNMNYAKTGHPVYALVWLLPVLVLCAARSLMALPQRFAAAAGWGAAAAALLGLIAFTTFQVAWYAGFFTLLAGVAFLALEPARVRAALAAVGARRLAAFAAIVIAVLAIALAPFVVAYLPSVLAGEERPFAHAVWWLPRPAALLDTGGGNVLWGWLGQALGARRPVAYSSAEHALAQTPIVVVACVVTLVWLWRRRSAGGADTRMAVLLAAGVAVAATLPLLVRVGSVVPWYGVWLAVPGGRAIRTPFRFQLVLALPVWLIVAYGAAQLRAGLAAAQSQAIAAAAVAALAALALAEQVNLAPVAFLDRPAERARLAAVGPPPASCRSFYVRSQEARRGLALQTDAMMVAARYAIPTVNGMSGAYPPGFEERMLLVPSYGPAVADWAQAYAIAPTLCVLELPEGRWIAPEG